MIRNGKEIPTTRMIIVEEVVQVHPQELQEVLLKEGLLKEGLLKEQEGLLEEFSSPDPDKGCFAKE